METAKKHLSAGFSLLGSIEFRLKGEDIDRLAMARQEFRQAYDRLDKIQKEQAEKSARGSRRAR